MLFLFLGMAEVALLFADRHTAQRTADVMADVAAERMAAEPGESWKAGWSAFVADEAARIDCADYEATVTFPDGTSAAGNRVVELQCRYEPLVTNGLWPGLVITVRGESVVRSAP